METENDTLKKDEKGMIIFLSKTGDHIFVGYPLSKNLCETM